jgi:hypothetical protein
MLQERQLRIFHVIVTIQFVVSASLVLFWSLWQTNLSWWQIFSLSTQGVVVVILGALVYGFAVFSGAAGARSEGEHPFSGSIYYRVFYLVVPVLAGLAAGCDYFLSEGIIEGVLGWALGTVIAAYAVWLFVDATVGIVEISLGANRRLRRARIAARREEAERRKRERAEFLARLRAQRAARLAALAPVVEKAAGRLTQVLLNSADDPRRGSDEAALIALEVWQTAGMDTMKEVYAEVVRACASRGHRDLAARLDYWWDGVGQWRQGESASTVPEVNA